MSSITGFDKLAAMAREMGFAEGADVYDIYFLDAEKNLIDVEKVKSNEGDTQKFTSYRLYKFVQTNPLPWDTVEIYRNEKWFATMFNEKNRD